MTDIIREIITLLPGELPTEVVLLIQAIIGLLLLLRGFSVIRFWLALIGITGGAYIGTLIIDRFALTGAFALLVLVLVALAGAAILATAFKFSFFIAGFIGGLFLGNYLLDVFFMDVPRTLLLLFGFVSAIFAVAMREKFIIAATAITGALFLVDGFVSLFYQYESGSLMNRLPELRIELAEDLVILMAIAVLAVLGILFQRKDRHRSRRF